MSNISTRNVLRMWWDTNPALVGYADTLQQAEAAERSLLDSTPFRGTPRQMVEEIERVRRVTGGAFVRFIIQTASGRSVSTQEVHDVVNEAECRRVFRGR